MRIIQLGGAAAQAPGLHRGRAHRQGGGEQTEPSQKPHEIIDVLSIRGWPKMAEPMQLQLMQLMQAIAVSALAQGNGSPMALQQGAPRLVVPAVEILQPTQSFSDHNAIE